MWNIYYFNEHCLFPIFEDLYMFLPLVSMWNVNCICLVIHGNPGSWVDLELYNNKRLFTVDRFKIILLRQLQCIQSMCLLVLCLPLVLSHLMRDIIMSVIYARYKNMHCDIL